MRRGMERAGILSAVLGGLLGLYRSFRPAIETSPNLNGHIRASTSYRSSDLALTSPESYQKPAKVSCPAFRACQTHPGSRGSRLYGSTGSRLSERSSVVHRHVTVSKTGSTGDPRHSVRCRSQKSRTVEIDGKRPHPPHPQPRQERPALPSGKSA